jgi:hypothetical protein
MNNEGFFIELSSNARGDPNNTVANFKNHIALASPLAGQWEAAVVEISYSKTWNNLKKSLDICFHIGEKKKEINT